MDLEEYRERIIECPEHDSPKFIDYIRNNNVVVDENDYWILIENCKYHTAKQGYYTAFFKPSSKYHDIHIGLILASEWSSLIRLYQAYANGWELKIKRYGDQSISRFHIHFIE